MQNFRLTTILSISGITFLGLYLIISLQSCSDESCDTINLGLIERLKEGPEYMDLGNVKEAIFKDEEGNALHLPWVGGRIDEREKEFTFRCETDGNFYNLLFKYYENHMSFQAEQNERLLKIVEEPGFPLPNSIEAVPDGSRAKILKQVANQVKVSIFDNRASPIKLSLYTTTNGNIDLDEINQFNNENLMFHETIQLNGRTFENVYSNRRDDVPGSEVYYSPGHGIVQFTDRDDRVLTLDSLIFY